MKIYFAPLEGITGYIFRQAYEKNFGGIDAYYTPFVTTRDGGIMKKKELRDILPEHNPGIRIVPQIMTNRAEDFCQAAGQMAEMGYDEVNLNLGCPSGTVVPKGKGAGFLREPEKLDRFLEEIFEKSATAISIKSRIGFYEVEEFPKLLEIYNQYPVKELILHLRTREEFYKGAVHPEIFRYAMEHSKNPLCYNGDIFSIDDLERVKDEFSTLEAVMIGRGFLKNPGFICSGKRIGDFEGVWKKASGLPEVSDDFKNQKEKSWKKNVYLFLQDLEQGYVEVMSGDIPVLFKMKEIWTHLQESFPDGKRWFKKIKKTKRLVEYDMIIAGIFKEFL